MNNEMVLMNSWNIEQHGASVGEDFDAKMGGVRLMLGKGGKEIHCTPVYIVYICGSGCYVQHTWR